MRYFVDMDHVHYRVHETLNPRQKTVSTGQGATLNKRSVFPGVPRQDVLNWIVAFFNGTDPAIVETEERPLAQIRRMIPELDYMRFHGLERLAIFLLVEGKTGFHSRPWVVGQIPPEESIPTITTELVKHRREFCSALTWMCSPKPAIRESLAVDSMKFFQANQIAQFTNLLKGDGGRPPYLEKESAEYLKYFEDHGLRHIRIDLSLPGQQLVSMVRSDHWIDLFCFFLLEECMFKRSTEMPLKLCDRCRRLFSSDRPDARFCPDGNCRSNAWWTKERKRDYRYIERLEQFAQLCSGGNRSYALTDLGAKLDKPQVRERLNQIVERWKDWQALGDKLECVRQIAVRHKAILGDVSGEWLKAAPKHSTKGKN
jgi:hypothetical protein